MRPESRKHLYDILQAADLVTQFTTGRSFEDYLDDVMLRSAVERQLGIVGEALNRLRQADPDTAARISDTRRIIGFRNLLVHGYDVVDSRLVWGVIEGYLPNLWREAAALLAEPEQ